MAPPEQEIGEATFQRLGELLKMLLKFIQARIANQGERQFFLIVQVLGGRRFAESR